MMDRLLKKHYVLSALSALLVIVIAILLSKFGSLISGRQARVFEVKDRIAAYEQNKKVFAEESSDIAEIRNRLERLERFIVTEERVPEVLSELETLSTEQSIKLSIVSVRSEAPRDETPAKLMINFTVEGSLSRIEALIDDILSRPYQVKFSRFNLYSSGGSVAQPDAGSEEKPASAAPLTWNLSAEIEVLSF